MNARFAKPAKEHILSPQRHGDTEKMTLNARPGPRSGPVRGRLCRPLVALADTSATFADFAYFACNWLLSVSVSLWLN